MSLSALRSGLGSGSLILWLNPPSLPLQGSYQGSKKAGYGSYHFLNSDVYEGEFCLDRMDGLGVYSFKHEGRWERITSGM